MVVRDLGWAITKDPLCIPVVRGESLVDEIWSALSFRDDIFVVDEGLG